MMTCYSLFYKKDTYSQSRRYFCIAKARQGMYTPFLEKTFPFLTKNKPSIQLGSFSVVHVSVLVCQYDS